MLRDLTSDLHSVKGYEKIMWISSDKHGWEKQCMYVLVSNQTHSFPQKCVLFVI
jgi:hypothetical protein